MSDPISSMGSPGQLPVTASTANPPLVFLGSTSSGAPTRGEGQALEGVAKGIVQGANPDLNAKKARSKSSESPVTIEDAAKVMREHLKNLPSDLQFLRDEDTGHTIFKVVNPVTKEVIRQYPPDELVELAKRLKQVDQGEGAGILLDKEL